MMRNSQKYIQYITSIPNKAFSYIIYFNEIVGKSKIYSRYFLVLIDFDIISFNNLIQKKNVGRIKGIEFFCLIVFSKLFKNIFHLVFGCIENCLFRENNKERIEIT